MVQKKDRHDSARDTLVHLGSKLVLLDFEQYADSIGVDDIDDLVYKKAQVHLDAIGDLILQHQLKALNKEFRADKSD